jgi:hypothetical protein
MTDEKISRAQHPATRHLLRFFKFEHLPAGVMRETSRACAELAHKWADELPDSPEKTEALRKLLEAKDCAVRAHIPDDQA